MADVGLAQASPPVGEPPGPDYPGDRPSRFRRRGAVLLIGLGVYGLAGVLRYLPGLLEAVYASTAGPFLTRWLSLATGLVPFALWEFLVLGYVGWRVWVASRALGSVWHRRRRVANAVGAGVALAARDVGIVLVLFYVLWGFNYSRAALPERFGWPEWSAPEAAELQSWAEDLVVEVNRAYSAIHDTTDAGQPTAVPADLTELLNALPTGWDRSAADLDLPRSMAARYGRVKFLASWQVFARLGIAGLFMPLTAEANVRPDLPLLSLPVSIAHEQAHQRGISSEAEAGFFGYVVAAQSGDPYARYAALANGLQRVMVSLRRADRAAATQVGQSIAPGVRRDYQYQADYFAQFAGVGTEVGRAVNDRYLRANRIRDGVANYGQAERLLISYARARSGQIVPPPAPEP